VVTTLDPLHATIVGGFYGIGLSIAVTISFLLFRRRNDNPLDPAHMLLRRSAPTRRAAGILLAGISLTLLVGLVN
jgi:hypothetical protein